MHEAAPHWLDLRQGTSPLIVSCPHAGTTIPSDIADMFAPNADVRRDTDWFMDKLLAPVLPGDATYIATQISRSVIDLNRAPNGKPLYPGQASTGLCPLTDFDGIPLYSDGSEPDDAEIDRRHEVYYAPYFEAVSEQIQRIYSVHGYAVLLDCHSIRPQIARLFDGTVPTLSIGTNSGKSCSPELTRRLCEVAQDSPFSWIENGRFKGGWITRHFGAPEKGVHATQIEIAMSAYIHADENGGYARPTFQAEFATLLQATLERYVRCHRNYKND